MTRILFVCLGNICRSPMAEYLCRAMAAEQGIPLIAASAGTSGWHDGEGMHCGTAEVLEAAGIAGNGFVSRRVRYGDFEDYDYLLAMDADNLAELERRFGRHPQKMFVITDLLADTARDHVPDPWHTGRFNETGDLLTACCRVLLARLAAGQPLSQPSPERLIGRESAGGIG